MSMPILGLTIVLLALPVVFLVASLLGATMLTVPALLVMVGYAWIWLRLRPSQFVVHPGGLDVHWPLKCVRIPRASISSVRVIDRQSLKQEVGWGLRLGAGGLWGGFGWLWTKHRGIVQMYVSRTDDFVWIERVGDRPWLLTPERPEAFVRALSC